ncbi:TPA: helix-turn-helix domain-containing protein [Salmonella enterica subsp. enterica serovar Muenchen]
MKTPVSMIEDIAAQIVEGRVLLENIYRESDENEKTDCSIACLLRSLEKTVDNAYEYVEQFSKNNKQPQPTPLQPGDTLTIGDRIQIARKNLDISVADLAHQLNTYSDDILDWEENITEPQAKHIIPLTNVLRCDLMWLLTGNPLNVEATPAPVNVMKGADLANIGVRIESRRNEMGMSPLKLAEKIDTSRAMILEWETGKAIPHSSYYDKLAKALNTTVTWLMTGKDINRQAEEKIKQQEKMVKPEMLFITVRHNVPAYYNDKDYSETGKAISDALVNYANRIHNDGYEPWTTSMEEVVTEDNTYITIQRGICNNENDLPLPKVERMNFNMDGVVRAVTL